MQRGGEMNLYGSCGMNVGWEGMCRDGVVYMEWSGGYVCGWRMYEWGKGADMYKYFNDSHISSFAMVMRMPLHWLQRHSNHIIQLSAPNSDKRSLFMPSYRLTIFIKVCLLISSVGCGKRLIIGLMHKNDVHFKQHKILLQHWNDMHASYTKWIVV